MRRIELEPVDAGYCRKLGVAARKWIAWDEPPLIAMEIGKGGISERTITYRHPDPLKVAIWPEMNGDLQVNCDLQALAIVCVADDLSGTELRDATILMEPSSFGIFVWKSGRWEDAVLLCNQGALTGHELLEKADAFFKRREAHGDGLETTEAALAALREVRQRT